MEKYPPELPETLGQVWHALKRYARWAWKNPVLLAVCLTPGILHGGLLLLAENSPPPPYSFGGLAESSRSRDLWFAAHGVAWLLHALIWQRSTSVYRKVQATWRARGLAEGASSPFAVAVVLGPALARRPSDILSFYPSIVPLPTDLMVLLVLLSGLISFLLTSPLSMRGFHLEARAWFASGLQLGVARSVLVFGMIPAIILSQGHPGAIDAAAYLMFYCVLSAIATVVALGSGRV